MADYIKGITVKIGGDTQELNKAVADVNKTISNTTKNLSEINKQLKFTDGAKSVELLTQKQAQLSKAIEDAKTKVDAYRQAQEQAAKALKNGDIGQETYDEITRKLMAAETQVIKFESELKKTNDALLEEKGAGDEAAKAVEEEGNAAEAASEKNSRLGDIAKAAAVAVTAVAVAAGKAAYDLGKSVVQAYGEYEQLVGGVETLFETDAEAIAAHAKNIGESTALALDEKTWEKLGEEVNTNAKDFDKWENDVSSSMDAVADGLTYGLGTASADLAGYLELLTESYGMTQEDAEKMANAVSQAISANAAALGDYADELNNVQDATEMIATKSAEAYKTAGLSMNEYMETVTSFSAALTQSLGGDVVAAAELADQAIIDMADNANKMGSDISSIQNAYQGFAKQNFSMLDNLKLGYGGTQAEMFRLMSDAAALNEEFAKTAEFSLDEKGHLEAGYADIVKAIHIVQTEMGITGTTAKEAEGTIQGSIAMTQAAWENFIVALGTGDQVDEALNHVTDSFSSVLENIQPVVERLIAALPTVLASLMPIVQELLPQILTTVTQLFSQVLTMLIQSIPMLIPVIMQMIQTIVSTLLENLPLLLTSAIQLFGAFIQGIVDMIPQLIETAITLVRTLADYLITNGPMLMDAAIGLIQQLLGYFVEYAPEILQAGLEVIMQLANGIMENLPAIIDAVTEVVNTFLNYILEHLPEIVEMGIEMIIKLTAGIIQSLPEIINAVIRMIFTFTTTIVQHLPEILQKGIEIIGQLVAGFVQAIPDLIKGVGEIVKTIVNSLKDSWEDFKNAGVNIIEGIVEGIKGAAGRLVSSVKEAASDALDAVKGFFDIESPSKVMKNEVGKMIDLGWAEGITAYADKVTAAANKVSDKLYGSIATQAANVDYSASINKTANLYITSPVYMDGKFMTQYVNTQLGVLL